MIKRKLNTIVGSSVFLIATIIISGGFLVFVPEEYWIVTTMLWIILAIAVCGFVGIIAFGVIAIIKSLIKELTAIETVPEEQKNTALTVREINDERKLASQSKDKAAAQIKELAGLTSSFFVEANRLSNWITSLRSTRKDIYEGKLNNETIGIVSAQDPSLASILNNPEVWTPEIKNSIAKALDREIGFLSVVVGQYRTRGLALLEQWQNLRTTIISIDYHLLDSKSIELAQETGQYLKEAFAALDNLESGNYANNNSMKDLVFSIFKWRVQEKPQPQSTKIINRLPKPSDFSINFTNRAENKTPLTIENEFSQR